MRKLFVSFIALLTAAGFGFTLYGPVAGPDTNTPLSYADGEQFYYDGSRVISNVVDTIDATNNWGLFWTNLSISIGFSPVIAPAITFVGAGATMNSNMYWYGQRVLLYNGLYTNNINNMPGGSYPVGLPQSISVTCGADYVRVVYSTLGMPDITKAPGLRIGHSTTVSTNWPVVLKAFGANATQDCLLVVWKSGSVSMSYIGVTNATDGVTNTYTRSVYPAALIRYEQDNDGYAYDGVGLAAYSMHTNLAEIIVVSTNGTDLTTVFGGGVISAGGPAGTRPWWNYDAGRDFMLYHTNNGAYVHIVGNYVSNTYQILNMNQ